MNALKSKIQPHINTEINIEFGCIGTRYLEILIVDNGKIKSIGSFLYRIWNENFSGHDVDEKLKELAIEAEKYRTGNRDKKPSLAFWDKDLKVI